MSTLTFWQPFGCPVLPARCRESRIKRGPGNPAQSGEHIGEGGTSVAPEGFRAFHLRLIRQQPDVVQHMRVQTVQRTA